MENAAQILGFSTVIILFLSWAITSYKTGILYSPQSSIKKDLPKYEIDKNKIQKFSLIIVMAFLLNLAYCSIFTHELLAILIFTLMNMVGVTYFLTYWVLFKEKKPKETKR